MSIRVVFDPQRFILTPQSDVNPKIKKVASPKDIAGKNDYMLTNGFRLIFENSGNGTNPLERYKYKNAKIVFHAKQKDNPNQPDWIKIGQLEGQMTMIEDTTTKTLFPVFECNKKNGNKTESTSYTLDNNNNTNPSDFIIFFNVPDQDKYVKHIFAPQKWEVRLPWIFDAKTKGSTPDSVIDPVPVFYVNTQLYIENNLEADYTVNVGMDVQMHHKQVYDDANNKNKKYNFYGVRTSYSLSNSRFGSNKCEFTAGTKFNVYVDNSVYSIKSFDEAKVKKSIENVFADAGFEKSAINVAKGSYSGGSNPFVNHNGIYMSGKISNTVPSGGTKSRRDQVEEQARDINNNGINFLDSEAQEIPFFDFYIFCEDRNVQPGSELGSGEYFSPQKGTVKGVKIGPPPTKLIDRPITIVKSEARNFLNSINDSDKELFISDVICHEIGHSFGLLHGQTLVINDNDPNNISCAFNLNDPKNKAIGVMNWMGALNINTTSGKIPFPEHFFGPVHKLSIKKYFLP